MKVEQLQIGPVGIEVRFKPIKNLHLSVHPPDGRVTISSPEFYELEKIRIYAATKLAWIKKEQRRFREQPREQARKFISRESHFLFGARLLMEVENGRKNQVSVKGKRLVLSITDPLNTALKRKTVHTFYKVQLRHHLDGFISKYSEIMDVKPAEIQIREMKTKWGSCSLGGKLIFNIELAKKPLECIEYIVVHELVHLIERHHNKRFILLMDQFLPNWRVQKKVLNELPL